MNEKPLTSLNDDENAVRILPADFSIKKKIGINVDLKQIFTPERIEAAQKTIDDTKSDFIKWAQKDLEDLEDAYSQLQKNLNGAQEPEVEKIRKLAFSLKCQAGTFGFDLGSEVARSMNNYINTHPTYDATTVTVLRKHIDALQVIFEQNIQGMGDKMGSELMDNLTKLVAKYE